ncbi:MAG: AraC family transcriptional regulator [Chthoniobacteraceae bacterium]|nr:AraC family transcriptional regulator [Chthoniobacteraceae bacterium]
MNTSEIRAKGYDKRAKRRRGPAPESAPGDAAQLGYWEETMVFPPHGGPAVIRRQTQCETAQHGHAFTELVIVTGGTGMHAVDGLRYPLSPGDLFVITGRRRHAYRDTRQLALVNVLVRGDFMRAHRRELDEIRGGRGLLGAAFHRPRTLAPEELDDCLRIVERIEQEVAGLREGGIAMQSALLLELLITVSRRVEAPAGVAELGRAQIGRALSFVDRHYAEELDLARMASAAGMSPRSFQRHFKAAVGLPPLKYLQRQRIANGCRLLRETGASIQAIAADCGLPEPAYFCRLFRQMTGTTPGAFRSRFTRDQDPGAGV